MKLTESCPFGHGNQSTRSVNAAVLCMRLGIALFRNQVPQTVRTPIQKQILDGMRSLISSHLLLMIQEILVSSKHVIQDETIWDDLPGLEPLSDDEEEDPIILDDLEETVNDPLEGNPSNLADSIEKHSSSLLQCLQTVLTQCQPFPGDGELVDPSYIWESPDSG